MGNSKSLVESKSFWISVLIVAGGVFVAFAEHLAAGGAITVLSLLSILVRTITDKPIDGIFPKLLLLGAISLPASSMAQDGSYMLPEDRPSFASQLPEAKPTAPYKQAHDRAMKSGKPLVVLVGASWCPPCRQAKARIAATSNGGVEYAYVDYDRERSTALKIMAGIKGIPHLAVWTRNGQRWSVKHHVGVQSSAFYRKVFNPPRARRPHGQAFPVWR